MASTPQSSQPEPANQAPALSKPSWLRPLLAACIILAPLSITLYLVAWTDTWPTTARLRSDGWRDW